MNKKMLYMFFENCLMTKFAIVTLSLLFCVSPAMAGKESVVISGDSIQRVLSTKDNILRTVEMENKIAKRKLSVTGPEFVITWGDGQELSSDEFKVISLESKAHSVIARLINDSHGIAAEITYSAADKSSLLYKQIQFTNTGLKPFLLRSVELEHLKINNEKVTYAVNEKFPEMADWGQPVYTESLWFGVEFPATRSSITSDGFIFLRHHPGIELAPGQSYLTKKAVLGAAVAGKVKESFMDYVATLPPHKQVPQMKLYWDGFRVIIPPDRLGQGLAMIEYAKKLKTETGFTFDAWTYDAGFDMYREDGLFVPREDNVWDKTNEVLKTINTPLGFWCSFSPIYDTPTHTWGKTQGYELQHDSSYCLAGPKYFSAIKKRLEDIVRKYRMGVINFDGMYWGQGFGCNQPGHGHLVGTDSDAGVYSLERVAENKLDIFHCLRDINPDIILDLFVCQEWASPWWLQELDGIHTVPGDTAAAGIASPWLRDELITVRDIQVFEEHRKKKRQFPLWAEDLYGSQVRKDHLIDGVIVTGESTTMRWEDEYVMALSGRGAITANVMCSDLEILDKTQSGLKFLGEVANWTRANESIYKDFHLIGGEPKELQAYGYSHCDGHGRAIVALRNPYITAQTFPLIIDESLGLKASDEKFYVNIVYPYRKTFTSVNFGEKVNVLLQDYEVMMLEVRSQSRQFKEINSPGRWDVSNSGRLVKYDESALLDLPKGKLSPLCKDDQVQLKGEVIIPKSAENGQIQIMLDPDEDIALSKPTILIDGQQAKFEFHERTGSVKQDWILVDIDPGTHNVQVVIENMTTTTVKIQAWLVANYKLDGKELSQKAPHLKELFPVFSSDWDRRSTPLLESFLVVKKLTPLPDGNIIFMSDLKGRCTETEVGYFEFSWDKSCWPGNPELKIGDAVYDKGLSFHAPGYANFNLDGQFKYFIADLGLLSTPLEKIPSKKVCGSSVLIIEADGKEIYRSAVLKEGQPAEHVKIDISGAKILKLICTDGGDGICDDLTVWAQARVEK